MATIYRSVGFVHACEPGQCPFCTQSYSPPPEDPSSYDECCRYIENGQRVVVVVCESVVPMTAPPRRKRPGGRVTTAAASAEHQVTLRPQARKKLPVKKKTAGHKKAGRSSKPRK